MKIAVYAISKNEVQFVERFINSARPADYCLIADTGSTDGTVEKARELGAKVIPIHVSPWRFDVARNAALALLPADIDVCVSLDLDEVLVFGWRNEIEKVWKLGETTRLRYGFNWGHNIVFQYEKIHARHGYYWHHPCHEYPRPDGRIKEVYAHTPKVLVEHYPDPTKSRGQYMELLELSVKEDPYCPRNAFYYARELTFHHRWPEAIAALEKYLAMPEANWDVERAYAMRLLGQANDMLGRGDQAMMWYRRACAEAPQVRDSWVALAMACNMRGLWEECFSAASTALRITEKKGGYTVDPAAWGARPHDLLALSAYHLGLREMAIEHGRKAVELDPADERLKSNLRFYETDRCNVLTD